MMRSAAIAVFLVAFGGLCAPAGVAEIAAGGSQAGNTGGIRGRLVLSRHQPMCVFCGARDDLTERAGKHACAACVSDLGAAQ